MQQQFTKLNKYVTENEMKINKEKSKIMLFNTAKKYDFIPQIYHGSDDCLDVVEEMKLLGLVFQSNMKWQSNTSSLCQGAYSRLWMLRNLKKTWGQ